MNTTILDNTFAALADPTRRAILARLAGGAVTVNELAEPFDISLPAISRHLNVLERAALIVREREGQFRRCRLNPDALKAASEWLDFYTRFWSESFDRLAQHLKNPPAKPTKPAKPRRRHGHRNRTRR
jgi:DNA-binding transcriptional ArsR family regulator